MTETTKSTLLGATEIACGILAFALLRWTPTTGKGILLYASLFGVVIIAAIALSSRTREGYWPKKPDDR